ncbi:T-cell-interacting, activating receptor on myeloid cells protein 1 isoform X1 [Rattus norvegicus]|uniref:T-cell-interacting, activating receptor on myeloid cells protein 1 isoform X1 n=1 Tax=Rattus norvegicus TaxID=10116 RepID=UPI0019176D07|nr:T-cell-interacting, activating receptor on myeloid cells protein 1 isoform X1 [Rattus norvegicus]
MICRLLSLLCLRLCVGQIGIPENGPPSKPSLSAWPSTVLPTKSNVILRCKSPTPSKHFILKKEGFVLDTVKPYNLTEEMANFHFTELRQSDGGHYTCEYYSKWSHNTLSQPSDALFLLVTGYLPKPSFQAHHRGTVTAGSTVTLQCQKAGSVLGPIWFALLKVGHSTPVQTRGSAGMVLDFSLQNVTARDAGKYSCVYYQAKAPYRASDPSNLLEISVIDNHLPQDSAASTFPPQPKETSYKPLDTMTEDYTMGNLIRIGVAAVIILIVGGFLVEAWHSERLSPNRQWDTQGKGCLPKANT